MHAVKAHVSWKVNEHFYDLRDRTTKLFIEFVYWCSFQDSLMHMDSYSCMQPYAYWTYLQIRNQLKSSRSRSNQTLPTNVQVANVISMFAFVWVETLNKKQFCPRRQRIERISVISVETSSSHLASDRNRLRIIFVEIIKREKRKMRESRKVEKQTQSNFEFRIVDNNNNSRCCR